MKTLSINRLKSMPRGGLNVLWSAPQRASVLVRSIKTRRPTQKQIAAARERSLQFMKRIWQRANAPYFSASPGPLPVDAPIKPAALSRL